MTTELKAQLKNALDSGKTREAIRLALALGDAYYARGTFDRALDSYTLSTRLSREIMDTTWLTESLYKLSDTYLMLNEPDKAMLRIVRGLELADRERDKLYVGKLWTLLGEAHLALQKPDEAQVDFEQAAKHLEKTGQWVEAGLAYGKRGTVLMDLEKNQEATIAFAQSISMLDKAHRPDLKMRALGNIGTAFGKLGRWKEAGKRHNMAMKLARQLGDRDEEAYQLNNLGYVAEMDGEYDWAVQFYRQTLYLAILGNQQRLMAGSAYDLARLISVDDKQVPQAITLLETVMQLDPERAEAETLLEELRQRQLILTAQGVAMEPAIADLRTYAAQAYEGQ